MTIRVIGAGFGRTGTSSLKVALEELGFGPCYHMTELFAHPEHVPVWEAAARGEPVDWERVFGGYRATMDWPGAPFYEDLMERYPEAKVVLTVRDPDRWYESTLNTIYAMKTVTGSPGYAFMALLVPPMARVKRAARVVTDLAWDGTFGGRFEDRERAIEAFERGNEEVRRRVPAEKLLVYEVKEGWGPLCAFLGVEAPEKPFPRLNDSAVFKRRVRAVRAVSVAGPVVLVSVAGLGLFFSLRGLFRR